ncbi:MAG TPA: helix-turn-helix domain-containing protein [Pseudolabrys sp.]|nr:helix-turn-helix domain-containing protein [Pseudolabrys sp.]
MSDVVQRLRDRIDELEAVLGTERSMVSRLRQAFGLNRRQAQILGTLLARDMVTRPALYAVLYGDSPDDKWPDDKVLDSHTCCLRRALRNKGVSIRTHWGEGWSIAPADKARIRVMLDGQHEAGHRIAG